MRSYYRPDYRHHQEGYHRARRRRVVAAAGRRAALGAVAAAVLAGAAVAWSQLGPGWVRGRLADLGLFRVDAVEVRGAAALPAHLVRATAGVAPGDSLLGVDLAAVRARLETNPRVRAAAVRRRLPGTLVVEIVERVPVAVARAGLDYLVDREGAVVEARPAGAAGDAGLPVVTGVAIAGGGLAEGAREDLLAALELLDAVRAVGFPALEAIERIDVGTPEDAVIVPRAGRPLVHAGRGGARERLARWRLVAPDMAARWPELEYVDLRAEGQVVALPATPAPEPAAPAAGAPGAPPAASPGKPAPRAGRGGSRA